MSKGSLLVACIVGDVKHDDSVECGVEADMKVPEKGGRLRRWKLEAKDSQPCPLPCVALLLTLILTLILHTVHGHCIPTRFIPSQYSYLWYTWHSSVHHRATSGV